MFKEQFIVTGNTIYTLQGDYVMEILGSVLAIDRSILTSLLAPRKISVVQFQKETKQENILALPYEFPIFLGSSIVKWHYNHDMENILLVAHENLIYFLCSQQGIYDSNSIGKQPYIKSDEEHRYFVEMDFNIINIYSLNQYKVIYLTRSTFGVINVRSLNIIE